jgi:hypothetical protein
MKMLAAIAIWILLVTLFSLADSLDWKTGKVSCPVESVIVAIFEVIGSIF